MFKERGILYELQLQYYGMDSKTRHKMSRYVPPPKKSESNLEKLEKMSKRSKLDDCYKKEFVKNVKRTAEKDRRIEKVMGKSYFG